jgi:hypothetical protein
MFADCVSGPAVPYINGCDEKDHDLDGDVDTGDFGLIQLCISGQNIPADPACDD